MKIGKIGLILLVIFLAGFFLRLYDLGGESLWLDETISLWISDSDVIERSSQEAQTPLYYLILHNWINFFGDSEFSVRFPSVIFGSLAVILMYILGKRLFNKEVGVLSSLILSISAYNIYFSQEARPYSLFVFLFLLSFYSFLLILEKKDVRNSSFYIISNILMIYTHIFGLFLVLAQTIYILYLFLSKKREKSLLKQWIIIQAVLFILFVPWLGFFIEQIAKIQGGVDFVNWISLPSLNAVYYSFQEFSGLLYFSSNEIFLILIPMFIIFLVLSLNAVLFFRKDGPKAGFIKTEENVLLLLFIFVPVILAFIISYAVFPIYVTRYLIPCSAAFYILVAAGLVKIKHKNLKTALIILLVLLSLVSVLFYHTAIKKEQWREAAEYIDENAHADDLVIFNAGYCQIAFDHYSKRTDLIKKTFPAKANVSVDEDDIKDLEWQISGSLRIWLVLSHSNDENYKIINETLSESCILLDHKKFYKVEIYLYEKKGAEEYRNYLKLNSNR